MRGERGVLFWEGKEGGKKKKEWESGGRGKGKVEGVGRG